MIPMKVRIDSIFRRALVGLVLTVSVSAHAASSAQRDAVLAALPKAAWVAQGQGDRILYLFIDPNYPYCQLLYQNLQPFIQKQNLQLRWVPVAIVDATSRGKAAAILEADDPAKALALNENRYNKDAHTGGIDEQLPSNKTEAQLRANEALLDKIGIPVVPTTVFKAKNGETVVIQGALSPLALAKVIARVR